MGTVLMFCVQDEVIQDLHSFINSW